MPTNLYSTIKNIIEINSDLIFILTYMYTSQQRCILPFRQKNLNCNITKKQLSSIEYLMGRNIELLGKSKLILCHLSRVLKDYATYEIHTSGKVNVSNNTTKCNCYCQKSERR